MFAEKFSLLCFKTFYIEEAVSKTGNGNGNGKLVTLC